MTFQRAKIPQGSFIAVKRYLIEVTTILGIKFQISLHNNYYLAFAKINKPLNFTGVILLCSFIIKTLRYGINNGTIFFLDGPDSNYLIVNGLVEMKIFQDDFSYRVYPEANFIGHSWATADRAQERLDQVRDKIFLGSEIKLDKVALVLQDSLFEIFIMEFLITPNRILERGNLWVTGRSSRCNS
jgi:hypothetical protein